MRGNGRLWTVVLAALVVAAAWAGGSPSSPGRADGIGRAAADTVALRELRPAARRGDVILFGLPRPLPAGAVVAPADPPAPGRTKTVRAAPLRAPAWLYWLDEQPYARFSHPSRWLLVDDATGRVVRRGATTWYPAVNGERPAFLATAAAYEAKAYRVFARVPSLPRRPSGVARAAARVAVPPGSFTGDCMLMVGDFDDDIATNDWPAMQSWARSVGIPASFASPSGPAPALPRESPSGADVNRSVDALVASGCKDVLVFASGHGLSEKQGPPTVVTGLAFDVNANLGVVDERATGFTAADMEGILEEHPETTFKLKVDACFSGRFVDALLPGEGPVAANGNLLIVEVSSQPGKASYSVPAFLKGENRDLNRRMGGFTRQNVAGLRAWAASPDEVAKTKALGGSLLAHALERAFQLGLPANAYNIETKGVKPRVRTNYPVTPPLAATGRLSATGTTASLALTNGGRDSIRCWRLGLPSGVLATGIGRPPAGWQLGSSQPPPAPSIGGRSTGSGLAAGVTETFTFTTNGPLRTGSTLHVSADCATDVPASVAGP